MNTTLKYHTATAIVLDEAFRSLGEVRMTAACVARLESSSAVRACDALTTDQMEALNLNEDDLIHVRGPIKLTHALLNSRL